MDSKEAKTSRLKTVAYWVSTILGPAGFVIGGFLDLTHNQQAMAAFASLGYPTYLLYILGTWKVLGAIATVLPGFPRLKEWAYAGFFFELTGAALSNAFAATVCWIFSLLWCFLLWSWRPGRSALRHEGSGARTVHDYWYRSQGEKQCHVNRGCLRELFWWFFQL